MFWLINVTGVLLLVFIVWWFWLSEPGAMRSLARVIDIKVADGVYTPAHIEIAKGQEVTLRFQRFDASPCAEIVRFDDLGIRLELPLNEPREVHLTIETAGKHDFACEMNMYHGMLVVK